MRRERQPCQRLRRRARRRRSLGLSPQRSPLCPNECVPEPTGEGPLRGSLALVQDAHLAVASLRGRSPLQVRWTGTPRRVVRLEVGFGERGCAGLSPSLNGLRRQTARASTNTINPPAIRVRNVIDARSCAGSANGTSGLLPCFVS